MEASRLGDKAVTTLSIFALCTAWSKNSHFSLHLGCYNEASSACRIGTHVAIQAACTPLAWGLYTCINLVKEKRECWKCVEHVECWPCPQAFSLTHHIKISWKNNKREKVWYAQACEQHRPFEHGQSTAHNTWSPCTIWRWNWHCSESRRKATVEKKMSTLPRFRCRSSAGPTTKAKLYASSLYYLDANCLLGPLPHPSSFHSSLLFGV